jgi:hypothetical protein
VIYPSTTTPSVFLYPSTVTDADLEPPSPVHEIEKLLSPAVDIVTDAEPEVEVCEVQSAEQEDALDEDQVRVDVLSKRTDVGLAERLIFGGLGGGGVEGSLPPPPPPPPQEAINIQAETRLNFLYIYMYLNLT